MEDNQQKQMYLKYTTLYISILNNAYCEYNVQMMIDKFVVGS